ncbi:hypothetical protein [Bacillus thuringiensis]|uniref:hypothetical protein n=1 Tax=Bacillus thuringiensis TaxID=1428 RepID=UPI000676CF31|nr:hypothetical protein [Bacillus thuringiensis]AKR13048.1 hypothetical protein AC241_30685 [Bacillus thuringiensis]MBZ8125435.1 hypothetical protein [Bacillus thuringiensis]MEB4820319.1 hypothetical protein [Bacillus thuringiensis]
MKYLEVSMNGGYKHQVHMPLEEFEIWITGKEGLLLNKLILVGDVMINPTNISMVREKVNDNFEVPGVYKPK